MNCYSRRQTQRTVHCVCCRLRIVRNLNLKQAKRSTMRNASGDKCETEDNQVLQKGITLLDASQYHEFGPQSNEDDNEPELSESIDIARSVAPPLLLCSTYTQPNPKHTHIHIHRIRICVYLHAFVFAHTPTHTHKTRSSVDLQCATPDTQKEANVHCGWGRARAASCRSFVVIITIATNIEQ